MRNNKQSQVRFTVSDNAVPDISSLESSTATADDLSVNLPVAAIVSTFIPSESISSCYTLINKTTQQPQRLAPPTNQRSRRLNNHSSMGNLTLHLILSILNRNFNHHYGPIKT